MYHYIDDKRFLKKMKSLCSQTVNQLVQSINNDSLMRVEAHLVGSGAKNLITQNANEPIDLDYNICVVEVFGISLNDGKVIKDHIGRHFNKVLKNNGWNSNCQDSTSVLSSRTRHFAEGNKTEFKIDIAIVREDCYGWRRLIHRKTGYTSSDQWYWNKGPDSCRLYDKVEKIKSENRWQEVRERYLEKKNMYLHRGEGDDHPSFNVYIETVNEIYSKYFRHGLVYC